MEKASHDGQNGGFLCWERQVHKRDKEDVRSSATRQIMTKTRTNTNTSKPVEVVVNDLVRIWCGLFHFAKRGRALLIVGEGTHTREVCAVTEARDVDQEIELRLLCASWVG